MFRNIPRIYFFAAAGIALLLAVTAAFRHNSFPRVPPAIPPNPSASLSKEQPQVMKMAGVRDYPRKIAVENLEKVPVVIAPKSQSKDQIK